MQTTDEILSKTTHRPWPIPQGKWSYYQEWNNALFLHWKISSKELEKYIPANLILDTYDRESWVSLVAFTMERISRRHLPSIPLISNFHEINIRTYLAIDNKPGVFFLNIEAGKRLSCFAARQLSGLPYRKSKIYRGIDNDTNRYNAAQKTKGYQFEAAFKTGQKILTKTDLDVWLTERYCLYLDKGDRIYRYEIHHQPWCLYEVEVDKLITEYRFGNISLNRKPDLIHYSEGVKVIAWKATEL